MEKLQQFTCRPTASNIATSRLISFFACGLSINGCSSEWQIVNYLDFGGADHLKRGFTRKVAQVLMPATASAAAAKLSAGLLIEVIKKAT